MRHSFFSLTVLSLLSVLATSATAAEKAAKPVEPQQPIQLFNGKDLSDFTTWLKKTGHEDPAQVFSVVDGTIRATDADMGYLATKKAYKNYHLSVEYRWGRKNETSKYVRNSGVLLHGSGPDGAAGGVWMSSIECQLAQGCEGDIIVIRGKNADGERADVTLSSETVKAEDNKTRWKQGGEKVAYSGRQFWWSKHQPFFKELIDTRGKNDVASPLGEWTRVECICSGDQITIKINGETVNQVIDVKPTAGKILLQTEGHEVFFRNVTLQPLAR